MNGIIIKIKLIKKNIILEKEKKYMKKEIKYKNASKSIADGIVESVIIEDFLPAPNQLIFKEDTAKITLNLNKRSIAFFKGKAK